MDVLSLRLAAYFLRRAFPRNAKPTSRRVFVTCRFQFTRARKKYKREAKKRGVNERFHKLALVLVNFERRKKTPRMPAGTSLNFTVFLPVEKQFRFFFLLLFLLPFELFSSSRCSRSRFEVLFLLETKPLYAVCYFAGRGPFHSLFLSSQGRWIKLRHPHESMYAMPR